MSNKRYGIGKERQAKEILLKQGALCVLRARGSLGLFDLVALFPKYSKWISVKSGRAKYLKSSLAEWRKNKVKLPQNHIAEIWLYERGGGWTIVS